MTTPERLRRRQRVEGALLMLIGLAMIAQAWYFHDQDREQRECLADTVSDLGSTLTARSAANQEVDQAVSRIWDTYAEAAGLIKDPTQPSIDPDDQGRLNAQLVDALLDYKSAAAEAEKAHKENPPSDYPTGRC